MTQKLSRNIRKTIEKQQIEAMQHYLDYLKSNGGSLNKEEKEEGIAVQSSQWRVSTVMYPPFED